MPAVPALPTDPPPFELIGDVFAKFVVIYGQGKVLSMLDGIGSDEDDFDAKVRVVQEEWRQRLRGVSVFQIGIAIERLGEAHAKFPPNVLEFVALCKSVRLPEQRPAFDLDSEDKKTTKQPYRDPERWRAAMMKLAEGYKANHEDRLGWAKEILARHRRGETVTAERLAMAKRALRMSDDEPIAPQTAGSFPGVPVEAWPEAMRPKRGSSSMPGEDRFGS